MIQVSFGMLAEFKLEPTEMVHLVHDSDCREYLEVSKFHVILPGLDKRAIYCYLKRIAKSSLLSGRLLHCPNRLDEISFYFHRLNIALIDDM